MPAPAMVTHILAKYRTALVFGNVDHLRCDPFISIATLAAALADDFFLMGANVNGWHSASFLQKIKTTQPLIIPADLLHPRTATMAPCTRWTQHRSEHRMAV